MDTTIKLPMTDIYMSMLESLSRSEKLDLIEKLKASLAAITPKKKEVTAASIFAECEGDWGASEGLTSEEYVERLRASRVSTRTVEPW